MEKREKSDIISSINDNKDSRVKNEAFPLNVEHPCIAEMAYIQSERYLRHLNLRCRIPDPVPAGVRITDTSFAWNKHDLTPRI